MLPIDHLSASSISLFLRCPEQWRQKYILSRPEIQSAALVLGSAVHLGLSRVLMGEDPGSFWLETLKEKKEEGALIDWSRMRADVCAEWAVKLVYHYYEQVGKHLDVLDTEIEIEIGVPGVPLPVVGFVDFVTPEGIVDVKTTGYLSPKQVRLNPEWKLQMNIYQLDHSVPGEFHVLTRSKTTSVVLPDSPSHFLYVSVAERERTERLIRQTYQKMSYAYETWGMRQPWTGGETHEWAGKYCPLPEGQCCQK